MSVKIRYLLWLTIALWSFQASAQPLFRYEHDWTVTVGGQMYGMREVVQTPGEFHRTQFWMAGHLFEMRLAAQHIALVLTALPVAVAALWYMSRRSGRRQ